MKFTFKPQENNYTYKNDYRAYDILGIDGPNDYPNKRIQNFHNLHKPVLFSSPNRNAH